MTMGHNTYGVGVAPAAAVFFRSSRRIATSALVRNSASLKAGAGKTVAHMTVVSRVPQAVCTTRPHNTRGRRLTCREVELLHVLLLVLLYFAYERHGDSAATTLSAVQRPALQLKKLCWTTTILAVPGMLAIRFAAAAGFLPPTSQRVWPDLTRALVLRDRRCLVVKLQLLRSSMI